MWFLFLSSSFVGLFSIYKIYITKLLPAPTKRFDDDSDDENSSLGPNDENTEDEPNNDYKFICYRVVYEDNSDEVFDELDNDKLSELYKVNDDPKYTKPDDWVDNEMIPNPNFKKLDDDDNDDTKPPTVPEKLEDLDDTKPPTVPEKLEDLDEVSMRRETLVEFVEPVSEEPEMIPNPDYIGEWVEPEHDGLMVKFIILEYMYNNKLMKQIIKNRVLSFPIYNFPIRKTEFEYYPEQMFLDGVDITSYVKLYCGPAINFYMDTDHDQYLSDILYDHPVLKILSLQKKVMICGFLHVLRSSVIENY